MANLNRTAKSGSNWTINELQAYNIVVHRQSPDEFFGREPTSTLNQLDPDFVSGTLNSEGLSDETHRLLQYLRFATTVDKGKESGIVDFAKEVLRVVGFEDRGTVLRAHYEIPLLVCGEWQAVQADVCLVHRSGILLVVQTEMATSSGRDPEVEVIAGAIAAFQDNNRIRSDMALGELDAMTIPCVTVFGTRPTFYKVPVTKTLSNAVIAGRYAPDTTHVTKCGVPSQSRQVNEGMDVGDFRKLILQHYDGFKTVAKTLWSDLLV